MLPDTYSELYPGRFMKADLLKGRKITLTIEEIDIQKLVGETGKEAAKVIVIFAKPQAEALAKLPLELVLPKTNGECFRRMFGNNPHTWKGKRVTLFPTTTKFGPSTVDCIRIWGSPDIEQDMPITIPQGRKKALEMVMHKVATKSGTSQPTTAPDPRISAAFGILEWTSQEQSDFLTKHANFTPADMLAELNAAIDARNAVEA